MKKIPTAEEFYAQCRKEWDVNGDYPIPNPIEFAKEYAKLVKNAALEAAAQNAEVKYDWRAEIDESTILNAYPDELIK